MARISLEHVTKHYGSYVAVDDFSLDISDGELIAVLGPSGCGKTTTLRMIAGFVEPSGGGIHIDGRDVTRLPAHRRVALGMARTFQVTEIFPELTVAENVRIAA
ncbi:MAG: ATP-binding cassette domain-containing protein, partial [bacterium]|nr:ATP-binding cassette domain-containing protein [bacterium]